MRKKNLIDGRLVNERTLQVHHGKAGGQGLDWKNSVAFDSEPLLSLSRKKTRCRGVEKSTTDL